MDANGGFASTSSGKTRSPQPGKSEFQEVEMDETFIEQEVDDFRRKLEKYHAQVIRKRKLKPHITRDWIETLKSKLKAC